MFRKCSTVLGKSLVVAELANGTVTPATLAAITAAKACGPVTAIVGGADAADQAKALAACAGVESVISVEGEEYSHGLPENWGPLVAKTVQSGSFTHCFAGTSAFGKNVIPRAAVKCDSMPISDISAVEGEDTFVRLSYAGNAVNTVKSSDKIKFATVRGTAFDRAATTGGSAAVAAGEKADTSSNAKWVEDLIAKSDKPDLTSAPNVVSGGRGIKSAENFKILDELAKPLKAAVGASRAVVDAGWAPNDMQIGQTGKVVAPNLYIACGISGAIQHTAGMKDSKTIVAINTDADAPIFNLADYGLVEDLFKAVPELTKAISK